LTPAKFWILVSTKPVDGTGKETVATPIVSILQQKKKSWPILRRYQRHQWWNVNLAPYRCHWNQRKVNLCQWHQRTVCYRYWFMRKKVKKSCDTVPLTEVCWGKCIKMSVRFKCKYSSGKSLIWAPFDQRYTTSITILPLVSRAR
jgi:hypothetical protein